MLCYYRLYEPLLWYFCVPFEALVHILETCTVSKCLILCSKVKRKSKWFWLDGFEITNDPFFFPSFENHIFFTSLWELDFWSKIFEGDNVPIWKNLNDPIKRLYYNNTKSNIVFLSYYLCVKCERFSWD